MSVGDTMESEILGANTCGSVPELAETFTSACAEHDKFTGLKFECLGQTVVGTKELFKIRLENGVELLALGEEVSSLS